MKKTIIVKSKNYKLPSDEGSNVKLGDLKQIFHLMCTDFTNDELTQVNYSVSDWNGKITLVLTEQRLETDEEYNDRITKEEQNKIKQLRAIYDLVQQLDQESLEKANDIITRRLSK